MNEEHASLQTNRALWSMKILLNPLISHVLSNHPTISAPPDNSRPLEWPSSQGPLGIMGSCIKQDEITALTDWDQCTFTEFVL